MGKEKKEEYDFIKFIKDLSNRPGFTKNRFCIEYCGIKYVKWKKIVSKK